MELATEVFAALFLGIIGLSHLLQPRAWVDFFILLRSKGHAGVFVNGFLTLGFGSIIVAFHNVWSGLPVVLTLIGWAQVLKGFLSFVAPKIALWGFSRISVERTWQFRVGGIFALGVSALLWYVVLSRLESA
jgi:hypothetical protein